jgi:PAS domain S-box-containing protein
MNDYMKHHYGIEGDPVGQTCYKILQEGMSEKCEFCPCKQLDKEPDGVVIWEENSPLTNRTYRNTDRYIDWTDGTKVHIQHSVDITDIMKTQASLKLMAEELECALDSAVEANTENSALIKLIEHRDMMLQAVNQATGFLFNSSIESFDADIVQAMGMICEAVNADRVYIWKNSLEDGELCGTQQYIWYQGRPPENHDAPLHFKYDELMPGWEDILSSGKSINALVRDLPPSAQEFLSARGIVSLLNFPIVVGGDFWGIMGFTDCRSERFFSEEEEAILRSCGLLFANAVIRNEMIDQLLKRDTMMEGLVEERTRELAMQTSTFTTLFNTIPDLIFIKDIDSRYTHCNQALLDYFGRGIEEVRGKGDVEGFGMPPELGKQHEDKERGIIRDGIPVTVEEFLPNFEGELALFTTTVLPLMLDGEAVGTMGIAHDISQIKEAERKMALRYDYSKQLSDALAAMYSISTA